MVCPTTLLARQHYNNFVARFDGFPIKIGRLSRLVAAAEAKATQAKGWPTARSTSSSARTRSWPRAIEFKRLGLVVVDEEQRFGVTHKERLKALQADVHVLTLTATPIPRTLQMAMSGLRELSVIQTPPVDRLAVRTYVMPWDPVVLREALLREHYRGGQSFFVTPAHRGPARYRGIPARGGARGPLRRRARPDGADRGRGADVRLLRQEVRGAGLDHDRRERARHPERQHDDRPPRRPLRPRPALSAARPRRAVEDARLCLSDHARPNRIDHRDRGEAAEGAVRSRHARRRASSSPATISTFAARAICSATSNRGISRRSATNSTSRCWRRRSWRPRPAACAQRPRDFSPADHRRCADHDPRGLCPRSRPAHGPLSPPQRARGPGRRSRRSPPR